MKTRLTALLWALLLPASALWLQGCPSKDNNPTAPAPVTVVELVTATLTLTPTASPTVTPGGPATATPVPAPVAINGYFTTIENTALVLSNSTLNSLTSDPNGDPLIFIFPGSPDNGTVSLVHVSHTNTVTYTPNNGFYGTDSFAFYVHDQATNEDSSVQTMVITVVQLTATPTITLTSTPTGTPTNSATPTPSGTPTDSPTVTASPTITETPTVTLTPSPITPIDQSLWANGSFYPWWGQAITIYNNDASNETVTDTITGDTIALAFVAPSNFVGYNAGLIFLIPNCVNASNYYAAGHIQFDIMLGPASDSNTAQNLNVNYGGIQCNGYGGPGCYNYGTQYAPNVSLSTSAFTHISVPFTAFPQNDTVSVQQIQIDTVPTAAGIIYYLDNLQFTAD